MSDFFHCLIPASKSFSQTRELMIPNPLNLWPKPSFKNILHYHTFPSSTIPTSPAHIPPLNHNAIASPQASNPTRKTSNQHPRNIDRQRNPLIGPKERENEWLDQRNAAGVRHATAHQPLERIRGTPIRVIRHALSTVCRCCCLSSGKIEHQQTG